MEKRRKKYNVATTYIVIASALMLLANVALGITLATRSSKAMKDIVFNDMLTVANTAASLIDGDELASLTINDVPASRGGEEGKTQGSPAYENIYDVLYRLSKSQNSDVKYIYLVKKVDDHYVYTVDPDPEDPANFGESLFDTDDNYISTPAQNKAWEGTAGVDEETVPDEWGNYYTAWSPIYSKGKVVGLVGVDFDSARYDAQMSDHMRLIIIFAALSVLVSTAIIVAFTIHLRIRFSKLEKEITTLSSDLDTLFDEIEKDDEEYHMHKDESDESGDVLTFLSKKTTHMREMLKEHLEYMHKQANTDYMTNTGNVRAYFADTDKADEAIKSGDADFAVVLFDINGLKKANDNYGHDCGNFLIRSAAKAIRKAFKNNDIYRIGGDEFVAVPRSVDAEILDEAFAVLDREIERINDNNVKYKARLALAKGYAIFSPEIDVNYQSVFNRADNAMYEDKEKFYVSIGEKHN